MCRYIKNTAILVFITIFVSGCSVVNSLRMMNANDDIEAVWPEMVSEQNLQATYIGEKPYIHAIVNGNTELLFLIDTGASFTILFDTPKVQGLTKEKGFDLEVGGWGEGENSKAYQSEIQSLALAGVKFEHVKVAYIPISTSAYYSRADEAIFDGVIGHDLLRHFSWTLDKKSGVITISANSPEIKQGDAVMPVSTFLGKLSIPVKIAFNSEYQVERELLIDTGSRHYLKMSTAYLNKNDIEISSTNVTAADFGLNGMAEHQRITLPEVSFDHLRINGVKTNLIPSDDEDDWWIIGSALMNQFITIIDYPSNRFIIRPYPNASFSSRYNLSGLELRKLQNGNFVVRYVSSKLPAALAGIEVGNEVASINKIESSSLTEEQWLQLNADPQPIEICLINSVCKQFKTKHIQGYSTLY